MTNINKIRLLDESVYNKIAAGEVVGRPASVVKELLENSIDAGARNIVLSVKDAGKRLIRVSDDGEGMSESDATLSIKRHATSKIREASDLENIGTFGFRGEALSSIAAVSNLTIKTNNDENELGSIVTVSGSEIKIEKEALPKGTTVEVKNLFYNVPARKNFLKSNQTEFKKIVEVFNHIALAYPEISFKLYRDGALYLNYLPGGFEERMKMIFGEEIIDMSINFEEKADYIAAFGYTAKPTYLTDSKNNQHLYVNGRYVKNRTVNNAVFAAYENLIAKGEYPFFVLFLTIDTAMVDVNVHPTKEEIKFYDDAQIYSFVKAVIKKALGSYDFIPKIKPEGTKSAEKIKLVVSNAKKDEKFLAENYASKKTSVTNEQELDLLFDEIEENLFSSANARQTDERGARQLSFDNRKNKSVPMIFYAHKKYIVTQVKSGLMIIDANRAHRRILFEKALDALRKGVPFSQQLLFAQTFQLKKEIYELLQRYDAKISRLGFEIKYHGKNTISITGVPSSVKLGNESKTLLGILNALYKYEEGDTEKIIAETFAEEAAVKEGEDLNENELGLIVDQLFATSAPNVTPEGKRTFVKISTNEISGMLDLNSK